MTSIVTPPPRALATRQYPKISQSTSQTPLTIKMSLASLRRKDTKKPRIYLARRIVKPFFAPQKTPRRPLSPLRTASPATFVFEFGKPRISSPRAARIPFFALGYSNEVMRVSEAFFTPETAPLYPTLDTFILQFRGFLQLPRLVFRDSEGFHCSELWVNGTLPRSP